MKRRRFPVRSAGGQVVQVADALNALIFDQVADGFQQAGLVDHVGDLGNHNLIPAVLLLHDLGTATQGDLAAACGICRTDAAASHNHAAGGEMIIKKAITERPIGWLESSQIVSARKMEV